jgi:hypothetical protein
MELLGFFPEGLYPFKIQAIFKFELLPHFLNRNSEGFSSGAKKESCSLLTIGSPQKVS